MTGSLLTVDDPWLEPIWKTAGELNMPVVIHTGDPKAFWEPVNADNERHEELLRASELVKSRNRRTSSFTPKPAHHDH